MWLDTYTTRAKITNYAKDNYRCDGDDRAKLVINELAKWHNHFWLIFTPSGELMCDVQWVDDPDPNHGLPEWFFSGVDCIAFEVDLTRDYLDWTPGMGPAPCWTKKFSKFGTSDQLFTAWDKWVKETY